MAWAKKAGGAAKKKGAAAKGSPKGKAAGKAPPRGKPSRTGGGKGPTRGAIFTRGLLLRGVLVYLVANLLINVGLSIWAPFSAWNLLTFRFLPQRVEAITYMALHQFPTHRCAAGELDLEALVQRAAREERVDPALLRALMMAESAGDPHAVSHVGAMGLTQLMPATAREVGLTDPFDPEQSLKGGAKYLRQMLSTFRGDVDLALAAYNAGPGAVQRFGGVPPYKETRQYVQKITSRLGRSKGQPPRSAAPRVAGAPKPTAPAARQGDSAAPAAPPPGTQKGGAPPAQAPAREPSPGAGKVLSEKPTDLTASRPDTPPLPTGPSPASGPAPSPQSSPP